MEYPAQGALFQVEQLSALAFEEVVAGNDLLDSILGSASRVSVLSSFDASYGRLYRQVAQLIAADPSSETDGSAQSLFEIKKDS